MTKRTKQLFSSQKSEVERNCARAIVAGERLIEVMRLCYSKNSVAYRVYLAVGQAMILYGEALEVAYVKSCSKVKRTAKSFTKQMETVVLLEKLLAEGLQTIEKDLEEVMLASSEEWDWLVKVEELWSVRGFVQKYGMNQLIAMTNAMPNLYLEALMNLERSLIEDGWDHQAMQACFNHANQYLEELPDIYSEVQRVGSETYLRLFDASAYSDQDKIALVMGHMHAMIDDKGMLQLNGGYQLDPEMPPHHLFLASFAKAVVSAYPKGLLPKNNPNTPEEILKVIHQCRMYFDRHNITYIRTHYSGITDFDKLLAYGKEHRLNFSKTSRLHNRYSAYYPFKGQENDKVTTKNGLSEFIINVTTGKFITQWDILQEKNGQVGIFSKEYHPESLQAKEIVETESFNYSNQAKEHQLFDVEPARANEGLEHPIKVVAKKYWKSEFWSFQGGNYFESYKKKTDYPLLKRRKK